MVIISPVRYDLTVKDEEMQEQDLRADNEMREEVRAESQNRVINKSTLSFRAVKCSRAKLQKIGIYTILSYLRNYYWFIISAENESVKWLAPAWRRNMFTSDDLRLQALTKSHEWKESPALSASEGSDFLLTVYACYWYLPVGVARPRLRLVLWKFK